MDISLLNQKITIEKSEVAIDGYGNHINTWNEYYSCFATISGESGNESKEAGQVNDDISINFTIRYCEKVADINSLNYRVVFKDEIYNIVLIDHLNYKKKALKLKCKKEKYG